MLILSIPKRYKLCKNRLHELSPENLDKNNWCKACHKERVKHYRSKIPQTYNKGNQLKTRYGITLHKFNTLLSAQGNRCAICEGQFDGKVKPFVDHDHVTGTVRGLLCHKCNVAIGYFNEDCMVLERAVSYLEKTVAINYKVS